MGTRADFYVGRGKDAEWLGSIAWDGYPEGIGDGPMSRRPIFTAKREATYRKRVAEFLAGRDDATLPQHGWPWPWEDSSITDFAYAFDGGRVYAACFGYFWFDPKRAYPERKTDVKKCVFPNMRPDKSAPLGAPIGSKASGIMVISA